MTDFVATSLARRLLARMQDTHERRRISVFSGPPGVGKTTTIDEFVRRRPGEAIVVKASRRNAGEILVMQHTLEALSPLTGCSPRPSHMTIWSLRRRVFDATPPGPGAKKPWPQRRVPAGINCRGEPSSLTRRRTCLEALRYWNDGDRCYAPVPLGLIFVGNSEFSLAGSPTESVISAAVADRALYLQTFDYDDISDQDLELMIAAHGGFERCAVAEILQSIKVLRTPRSFRRLSDLLYELEQAADGRPVFREDVGRYLALT